MAPHLSHDEGSDEHIGVRIDEEEGNPSGQVK